MKSVKLAIIRSIPKTKDTFEILNFQIKYIVPTNNISGIIV